MLFHLFDEQAANSYEKSLEVPFSHRSIDDKGNK